MVRLTRYLRPKNEVAGVEMVPFTYSGVGCLISELHVVPVQTTAIMASTSKYDGFTVSCNLSCRVTLVVLPPRSLRRRIPIRSPVRRQPAYSLHNRKATIVSATEYSTAQTWKGAGCLRTAAHLHGLLYTHLSPHVPFLPLCIVVEHYFYLLYITLKLLRVSYLITPKRSPVP